MCYIPSQRERSCDFRRKEEARGKFRHCYFFTVVFESFLSSQFFCFATPSVSLTNRLDIIFISCANRIFYNRVKQIDSSEIHNRP